MKKLLATLFFSLCATITSAQVVNGSASAISGARWKITNISVQPQDLFYVGLQSSPSNLLSLDLLFNSQRFTRFSTYGDFGFLSGGSHLSYFVGNGHLFGNGASWLNLRDTIGSNWDCLLDSSLNGSCRVSSSSSRAIGEVSINWNP